MTKTHGDLARKNAPFGLWALFVGLDTGAQLAFKAGAASLEGLDIGPAWLLTVLTTPMILVAIVSYFLTFLVWMIILQRTDLSRAFPLTGLVFVIVPVLAVILFGEHISTLRMLGISCVLLGVVLLGRE